jgi:hypothetical protein
MRKVFPILAVVFLAASSLSYSKTFVVAKEDTLVGLIVNKNGKGISNVPVLIKGRSQVYKTDRKGIFMIAGPGLPDSITVMIPSRPIFRIPVNGNNYIKITHMGTDYSVSRAQDEIINIGYGSRRRSQSTSGEFSVSGDVLRETGETNLIQALAGKVPGLTVVYNENGNIGLQIRGATSFSGGNEPLYIVDGSITEDIRFINLNDVEKVDVLKDGSIYGARGANGAIIVVLK